MVGIKTGIVADASGSAFVEYQNTKVIATVHGPRASLWKTDFKEEAQIKVDIKYTPFAEKKKIKQRYQVRRNYF